MRVSHGGRLSLCIAAASAAIISLSSLAVPAGAAEQTPDPVPASAFPEVPERVPDRFIVKFSGGAAENPTTRGRAYGKIAHALGVSVKELRTTGDGAHVIRLDKSISDEASQKLLESLKGQPDVLYAEADSIVYPAMVPNDPYYPDQWSLSDEKGGLDLPAVWDKTTGSGQVVAVIDTGITAHSDLSANILPGYDMMTEGVFARDGDARDSNPQDNGDFIEGGQCGVDFPVPSSWHGTHVAGTIAAIANNGVGVSGVAPGVKVVPVRAMGSCGGLMSDVADAIIWASGGSVAGAPANANPARTINLSLGFFGECAITLQHAIDTAVSRRATVFAAAGNSNESASANAPANCRNVVSVAASDRDGNRAPYSNYGPTIDVTAPGGYKVTGEVNGIRSTFNTGSTIPEAEGYAYSHGTSMAAPHAAAVGALIVAADPSLSPAQVEQRLKSTARPLPGSCAGGCGAGLINPVAAVLPPGPNVDSSVPVITGKAAVGSTLTAVPGNWGPAPVALNYRWYRSGTVISGAGRTTYALTPGDLGQTISVRVTGVKEGYTSVGRYSVPTPAVAAGALTAPTPAISGAVKVGSKLTALPGTWTAGTTLNYRWYRSGVSITGAGYPTYVLTPADLGAKISLRVTGVKPGYTTVGRYSPATAAVAPGTLTAPTPTISGSARVGYTLTANPGVWTSGTTLTYQWYRSGTAIAGATGRTYKVISTDRYDTLKVRVRGSKPAHTTAFRYSASTVRVP